MGVIGQAFSPAFMQLVTSKNEREKDRNLQTAIADRELKMKSDQQRIGVEQQNIENAFMAQRQRVTKANDKSRLEIMKEEGRNKRAANSLELRKVLTTEAEKRKQHTADYTEQLKKQNNDRKNAKAKQQAELHPGRLVAQDDKHDDSTDRRLISKGKRDQMALDYANGQVKLENLKMDSPERSKIIKLQRERLSGMIASRKISDALKVVNLGETVKKDERKYRAIREKEFMAVNKYLLTVNEFGQTPEMVAQTGGKGGTPEVVFTSIMQMREQWGERWGDMGKEPQFKKTLRRLVEKDLWEKLGIAPEEGEEVLPGDTEKAMAKAAEQENKVPANPDAPANAGDASKGMTDLFN